jgi:hypothetical protein
MSGESLDPEKRGKVDTVEPSSLDGHEVTVEHGGVNPLHRNMQMIAMYVLSAQCLPFSISSFDRASSDFIYLRSNFIYLKPLHLSFNQASFALNQALFN